MKSKKQKSDPSAIKGKSVPAPQGMRFLDHSWAAGLLLLIITLLVYLPVTKCGYIWDDETYIQQNRILRTADGLWHIWFDFRATPQYYPMVHTSYWLEYRCWQLNPMGYHLVNVIIHALNALLVWRLLRFLRLPGAWLAAALFALHPVQVESVAWITERKNVLSGLFYLAATLTYLKFAFSDNSDLKPKKSQKLFVLSLLLFLCALFSKTVTCTLPAALLLILWWKRRRVLRRDVLTLIPFLVVGISLGLFTAWLEKYHVGAQGRDWDLTAVERFLVAGRALCFYAGKLLWPHPLIFTYPRWQINSALWWQFLYPLAALLTISLLGLARHRIGKGPLVAVLFFAGTLAPALGFFDVYPMQYSFVADHFQYLAGIAPLALIAALGVCLHRRLPEKAKIFTPLVPVLILTVLAALTWRQQKIYKNVETLWRDTLQKNPDSFMAHNNLGAFLCTQGSFDEAVKHFYRAIKLKPHHAEAHNNLAWVLATHPHPAARDPNEAIRLAERALALSPLENAAFYDTLAAAHAASGHFDQALSLAQQALAIASAQEKKELVREIRRRIDLYRQKIPYKMPPAYPGNIKP